jgi:hypothetical protein
LIPYLSFRSLAWTALAEGAEGRRIHIGAAVELDVVGGETVEM